MRNETRTELTRNGLGVEMSRRELPVLSALDEIFAQIDEHQGVILSSGFDYPGRHARWDIAFIKPAVEFTSQGRSFALRALNEKGAGVLALLDPLLAQADYLEEYLSAPEKIRGRAKKTDGHSVQELRSKEPSIFSVLRDIVNFFYLSEPTWGHFGWYGAFGYDLVQQFEPIKLRWPRQPNQKDCQLFLPLDLVVVDHQKEEAWELSFNFKTPLGDTKLLAGGGMLYRRPSQDQDKEREIVADHQIGEFAKKVEKVVEGTKRGDYFEVVLSQTFSLPFTGQPTAVFRRLADINPSPYMFLMNFGDEQLVGSSPEIFARISGGSYETCPIAGTVRRGASALEDADRVKELIGSRKDESELTMCTDVDRNDMARVCVPGSVRVIGRRQLEFYSHLIHTVDHLRGTLALGYDSLDALQTHMWACTVTGAPKPAALQEIENLENSPRGWYSGAIGLLSFNGDLNLGITIRTAHLHEGWATIRAGATLLYGSDPESEEQETRTKAQAFLSALTELTAKKGEKANPERGGYQAGIGRKILLVDYQDSFVHNLAAYLRYSGADVVTLRAGFSENKLDEICPDLVLLSPGPGSPADFHMTELIERLDKRELPIFGVCLGHQGLGQYFGARLAQLPIPVHGKETIVKNSGRSILQGLPERFAVGRYHSLYLERENFPENLEILAQTEVDSASLDPFPVVMAFAHKTRPIAGVQFHPESIMTLKNDVGQAIINNVLAMLVR